MNYTDFQAQINECDQDQQLQKHFPGKHCGVEDCEKQCAEALKIAQKLNLEPLPFVQKFITDKLAPKYGCSMPADCAAESLEKIRCRFGFIRPETAVAFDDSSFSIDSPSIKIYTFDSQNEKCPKCEPLENTRVTQQQWDDEEEMKRLKFWKQVDGVYRPHPHCKCVWKESVVNFADYEWKKLNNDELATYQIIVPVPLEQSLPPTVLQKKLASMTQLDPTEFTKWGKNIQCSVDKGNFKTTFSVDVPNIWICANLLQGVRKPKDLVINRGGEIGQAISYLGTWNKKEIFCNSIQELKSTLSSKCGRIWGFVLYAHGDSEGKIYESNGKVTTQEELISRVQNQGFKLAKVCLMQCYSGISHKFTRKDTHDNFIEDLGNQKKEKKITETEYQKIKSLSGRDAIYWYYKFCIQKYTAQANNPGITYYGSQISGETIISYFEGNWKMAWGQHIVGGEPTISYTGVNFMGINIEK